MRPLFLFLSLTVAQFFAFSQEVNFIHEYKFSQHIRAEMATGETRPLKAAQEFSYIGKCEEALKTYESLSSIHEELDSVTSEDSLYFKSLKPVDAIEYILRQAEQERIVITNEAHHKPLHRIFTRKLLKGLYERGYRYFGLEALSNCAYVPAEYCDSLINKRLYILNSPFVGTYIREPQMSNLIREAKEIGFTIFAYERFTEPRDSFQAAYVKAVLDKDPDAKILLHCGWHHLLEAENQGRKWMADYVQEFTGINPLTIYQDILTERYCIPENPYYELVNFDKPTVFLDENGKLSNGKKGFDKFDVLLYHPRTTYQYNRPDWLLTVGGNKFYNLDTEQITIGYPCIVKAFKADEPSEAVPIDIIELEWHLDQTALVLPPGEYRLELESINGEKQELSISIP